MRANRPEGRFRVSPVSLVYLLEHARSTMKHNERENVEPDSEFDLGSIRRPERSLSARDHYR